MGEFILSSDYKKSSNTELDFDRIREMLERYTAILEKKLEDKKLGSDGGILRSEPMTEVI